MKQIFDVDRPAGRLFYLLVSLLLAVGLGRATGPSLTSIQDTVYRANGDAAAGSVVITWPGFTTADNKPVAAGEMKVDIGAGGLLNVALAPNEGANPAGTYYKVVYKLTDGTTATEYWTVPALSPATIGSIRSTLVPQQVAMQVVSRQYVDSALATSDSQTVHKGGSESITGAKTFSVSPAVPTPATSGAAANKSYVDAAVAGVNGNFLLRSGDSMSGPLTLAGDPVSANQATTRHYVDFADQVLSDGLVQKLSRQGDTPITLASIAFATQYPNLQSAVNAAGPSGALLVPPDYAFTDTYTNPNQIAALDLRAGGTLNFAQVNASQAVEGKQVGRVRACHNFPGADAGAKIVACLADLPANGGMADACGFEGAQTISATINVTKKTRLRICGAQFTATVSPAFSVTADFVIEGTSRATSRITAAAGGIIFQGSGTVRNFEVRNLNLVGNGPGSKAIVTPNYGSGNDWAQGRFSFVDNLVTDFGDFAFDIGQSTYLVDLAEDLFMRNVGSVNVEWSADTVIRNSNFWYPRTNANYPIGRPQVRMKGGSTFSIENSDFERADETPTGGFQAADIFLEATSPGGAPGYGWIHFNKFGPEGESVTRPKVQFASSSGVTTDPVYSVVFDQNGFYGAGIGAVAIKMDNPVSRIRITNNYFGAFTTIVQDNAPLISSDVGHSVFDDSNVVVPPGGTNPTTAVNLFANGGRYFSQIADVGQGNDSGLPVRETTRMRESPELRNRVTNSENLTAGGGWSLNGVTSSCGQTDPFGTTRACLITTAGLAAPESIGAVLDNTNRRGRLVLKFWAKAGTLSSLQAGLYSGVGFQGSFPMFALGPDWKQYQFTYNGLSGASHNLYIYPGTGLGVEGGSVYLFGIQVSDFDSDYIKTTGTAVADAASGTRFEKNVLFNAPAMPAAAGGSNLGSSTVPWGDLFFAGSSSSPGSNNFRLTGSSTSGTRVVTAADGNSVTVLPDAGASNQFLTGISTTGAITRAQPTFGNLSGTAAASQGGTGQTTFTKGDLLVSPGSTLNRLGVGSDGQVLTADSTQTNGVKWATPAASGGAFLDYQKAASALVGDGTDKTMYTYSMPAGTLPAGRCVRIKAQFQHTTGSTSTTYKIFFGATVAALGSSTSASMGEATVEVCNDPAGTSTQQGSGARYQFGGTMSALAAISAPAEATATNAVVIKATFNVASTDQVTPKTWLVELIK